MKHYPEVRPLPSLSLTGEWAVLIGIIVISLVLTLAAVWLLPGSPKEEEQILSEKETDKESL